MPNSREQLSRGEIRRQRQTRRFIGRRAELSRFKRTLDSNDPENAKFLFHIHGLGGVGKSTLLGRWLEEARSTEGAVAVRVDENDIGGVPQVLKALAGKLAEVTGRKLDTFDKALEAHRKEQQAATAGGTVAENGTSLPSRAAAHGVVEVAKAVPGGSFVSAVATPDMLAQGFDWAFESTVGRRRRRPEGDVASLSSAFVSELHRIGEGRRWIVLVFDTWERIGPYLDGWLPKLLDNGFGKFPAKVIVVLAGRDELPEREWAVWRDDIQDLLLEEFTREETRSLLAQRGVTDPAVADAVQEVSGGLPLLVDLLAQADPGSAMEVGHDGDAVDRVVVRFLQWIQDTVHKETVVDCALAQQLNADIFTAAAPPDGRGLWEWLCGQSFVTGHGDHKQYHSVVRTSMIRHLRTHSPQRWQETHLRLAEFYAVRRTTVESELADEWAARRTDGARTLIDPVLWDDERWRRHRNAETYHRLCAAPRAALREALEQAVHAAWQDIGALRQWTDTLAQAARDSGDTTLKEWPGILRQAVTDEDPVACWTSLLTHGWLSTTSRAMALTYRGYHHADRDRDSQAMNDLNQALALTPRNHRTLALRGEAHRLAGRYDQAVTDLTTALEHDPTYSQALALRGEAHRLAGRYDQAVTDFTNALEHDPTDAWTLASRGQAHRAAGRYDQAVTDLTTALEHDPNLHWALTLRGQAHLLAGRYDQAVTDFTTALDHDPTDAWTLTWRGEAHRLAGRYDEAVSDFTTALEHDPSLHWALTWRGEAHRLAGR
ncbi:tetratricopeptide repeat protein, partial [Streptomyces sp. NPDC005840]|uniref:tetratricopeptide repeat protein n=1 Tax=Streptomyces sp. NPDC005840 TaxID=3157072 RepID=UPI0033CD23A9